MVTPKRDRVMESLNLRPKFSQELWLECGVSHDLLRLMQKSGSVVNLNAAHRGRGAVALWASVPFLRGVLRGVPK